MKNKNQQIDGYGRDKRPKTEKTKMEGNNDNWKLEKKLTQRKKPYSSPGIFEVSPKRCQMSMEGKIWEIGKFWVLWGAFVKKRSFGWFVRVMAGVSIAYSVSCRFCEFTAPEIRGHSDFDAVDCHRKLASK